MKFSTYPAPVIQNYYNTIQELEFGKLKKIRIKNFGL